MEIEMNRNDREQLMFLTRDLLDAFNALTSFIDAQVKKEEIKLSNMPDSLQEDSSINEDIENLNTANDSLDEISGTIEDIPSNLGIKIRARRETRKLESLGIQPSDDKGKELRTVRIYGLTTSRLAASFKAICNTSNITFNELLNRAMEMTVRAYEGK